jgi:hypothetical protein
MRANRRTVVRALERDRRHARDVDGALAPRSEQPALVGLAAQQREQIDREQDRRPSSPVTDFPTHTPHN